MKRILAVVLAAVLSVTLCLMLTGCDKPKIRVESVMKLTDDFSGTRTVTVVYPLNADIDAIKDDLLADSPLNLNLNGIGFSYLGATENGYSFELKLTFNHLAEYEEQVSAVIGRDANAVLARKDTVMFKGTRMAEDFDVSELIAWMVRDTASADAFKDYSFEYPYNKVNIGADSYDTGSTVGISDGKGIFINSVDVKTYNEKASLLGRTFDRSFVLSVPADIYSSNKKKINDYYEELTEGNALITDTHEGNSVLFTVTYEGLSLSELETVTAKVLDSSGVSVYYGDKENMSTPLFEGRVLEETLDTLSFDSQSGNPPKLRYTYTLPTNAVRGEGALYKNGGWENTGEWDDGAYRVEDASGLTHLRIFDGRQYYIDGVSFELTSLGDGQFRRATSFLYPIKNGFEGPVYAAKFFYARGTETKADNDGDHIVCSVVLEGNADEINTQMERIFGKGNYLSYDRKNGALSDKTTLNDYIDLREMLSIENATVDMTYTASADNGENIVTLENGGTETAYTGKDSSTVNIKGCVASVGYHGVIPKAGNIILYIIFGILLFGATTYAAFLMLTAPQRKRRALLRLPAGDDEEDEEEPEQQPEARQEMPASAPMQTTTFSIFELGILSRNKKYVEEINKDVEQRLRADRLEERKKELRRRELEEMEKKVYGKEEPPREQAQEEPQQAYEEPDDDSPRTIEILETLDKASKTEPQAPEPTDPMELLNLMNEEDGDDETGGV